MDTLAGIGEDERAKRRRYFLAGVAVALGLLLLWIIVQWAQGTLAGVVWFLLWYTNLALRSVPQVAFWIVFLCVAAAMAGTSLVRGLRLGRRVQRTPSPSRGSVEQLARSIEHARHSHYFKWALARDLSELLMDVLDGEEEPDYEIKRQWLSRAGLPPEIRAYADSAEWGTYAESAPARPRLLRAPFAAQEPSPLDLDPEVVVKFIEEQLEVAHDRGQP